VPSGKRSQWCLLQALPGITITVVASSAAPCGSATPTAISSTRARTAPDVIGTSAPDAVGSAAPASCSAAAPDLARAAIPGAAPYGFDRFSSLTASCEPEPSATRFRSEPTEDSGGPAKGTGKETAETKGVSLYSKHYVYNSISGELMDAIAQVNIPVYFFTGRYDYTDPFALTEQYFSKIDAPEKHVVWFEESAHFPFYEEPAAFAREMRGVLTSTQPSK
jgi:pimeloyl-ACP methyl ester carboxylesterase